MDYKLQNIFGYIEGYYGKLLTWENRYKIVHELKKNNFNTYFYCPKEDINHRFHWREKYPKTWIKEYKNFYNFSIKNKVNLISGISPGLDFKYDIKKDFNILLDKISQLQVSENQYIVLMFDDIPKEKIKNKYFNNIGILHSELANKIYTRLKGKIVFLPMIYSDELLNLCSFYFDQISQTLNPDIKILYCGKKIVSDSNYNKEISLLKKYIKNDIIFWDNFYANDYCPRKLYICPWYGRSKNNPTLFNLTGQIEIDLMLINIIKCSLSKKFSRKMLSKFIPIEFFKIKNFFDFKKHFTQEINYNYDETLNTLDKLLWEWKSPLSRELYPFLLSLKQDLQFVNNDINNKRIEKSYFQPLSITLKNSNKEGEKNE